MEEIGEHLIKFRLFDDYRIHTTVLKSSNVRDESNKYTLMPIHVANAARKCVPDGCAIGVVYPQVREVSYFGPDKYIVESGEAFPYLGLATVSVIGSIEVYEEKLRNGLINKKRTKREIVSIGAAHELSYLQVWEGTPPFERPRDHCENDKCLLNQNNFFDTEKGLCDDCWNERVIPRYDDGYIVWP